MSYTILIYLTIKKDHSLVLKKSYYYSIIYNKIWINKYNLNFTVNKSTLCIYLNYVYDADT